MPNQADLQPHELCTQNFMEINHFVQKLVAVLASLHAETQQSTSNTHLQRHHYSDDGDRDGPWNIGGC
jgi:hypothetical protein